MKDRRSFLKAAGAGFLSAAAYNDVLGANERVRVGHRADRQTAENRFGIELHCDLCVFFVTVW